MNTSSDKPSAADNQQETYSDFGAPLAKALGIPEGSKTDVVDKAKELLDAGRGEQLKAVIESLPPELQEEARGFLAVVLHIEGYREPNE